MASSYPPKKQSGQSFSDEDKKALRNRAKPLAGSSTFKYKGVTVPIGRPSRQPKRGSGARRSAPKK